MKAGVVDAAVMALLSVAELLVSAAIAIVEPARPNPKTVAIIIFLNIIFSSAICMECSH
ncbi:hypothetical protein GCD22_00884 [Acidithiobacillus thiooxidans ATCC 19377]|uniref:Uncharacterized protein n=1 Tax=Acidithiobacillus thiooxidans ATCC 19377 TaxID=637390 RepID=A0A5P9XNR0_ACITH|nr:hypothetical protein GCD22_00884 [Acidithiobacillus thiooxidans ATCC 19377]